MTDARWVLIYRKGLIAAAVLVVVVLAWLDTAPNGKLNIHHPFREDSAFVSEVVPTQRTQQASDGVSVVQEPVYVTLRYPRPFKTASVTLTFDNPSNDFLEFGPQSAAGEQYDRQGINHPGLNTLVEAPGWERAAVLATNGATVWQQRSSSYLYRSPEQFLATPPDQEHAAYYGVEWPSPYLPDVRNPKQATAQTISVPLRGSHVFYVATGQDAVSFHADVIDLNREQGSDQALFQIKAWNGAVLAEQRLDDDGNVSDDGRFSTSRPVDLVYTGIKTPQVLQITVSGTNDLVMQHIQSLAQYLVVRGHVSIAGGPLVREALGKDVVGPIALITSARAITLRTNHVESEQTVTLGDESIKLDQPFVDHNYVMAATHAFPLSKGYAMQLEKGNVSFEGRGVFAFSQQAYFSPTPWIFDETVDAATLGLQYVLARYQPPTSLGMSRFSQTIDIDLSQVFAPNQSLRFQLASPAISSDKPVLLESLDVSFRSDPLTLSNIGEKGRRFFDRLF